MPNENNGAQNSKPGLIPKMGFASIFSVSCVWFASHAGGGFATGNQATQYYVQYGWFAPIMAVLAMAVLGFTMRELMILYNTRGCKNYKELFCTLYHPYDKLEILFEIYFFIIVICAVSASIAGGATLFEEVNVSYGVGVVIVGALCLVLTIFGAKLVSRASTAMSVIILVCVLSIFYMGIKGALPEIQNIYAEKWATTSVGYPLWRVVTYAGFQAVVVPAMASCGASLKSAKNVSRAVFYSFIINAVALALSCLMLLGWYQRYTEAGATALPAIYICKALESPILLYAYSVSLFLCFVSTSVTSIYGMVTRFESNAFLTAKISNTLVRRVTLSFLCVFISMGFSMVGLTNVIKYGYGYCGIIGLFIVVIPGLIVGHIKNKKFLKENPDYIGE